MTKKVLIAVCAIIVLLGCIFGICTLLGVKGKDKPVKEVNSEAKKFKEEYESLNGTKRESDGAIYHDVTIDEDNPIKYVSATEATNIIKNKTGILYFGANWCPWCRNAVPVMFEAAKELNIDKIYYVHMDDIRNVWAVEDGKLVKTQEEAIGYYDLLKALDSELGKDTYVVEKDGKKYDTKEKRIYMPFVVAVKDGKVVGTHTGTVKLNEDQTKYDKLTDSQHDELLDTYVKLFKKTLEVESCKLDTKCD